MIIDAHCHIWDKSMVSGGFKRLVDDGAKQMGLSDPSTLYDGSAERLIREMEEAGIDKTVILALDGHIAFTANLTYKDYNDYVANIVNEYPDKFIGFAGIDPRRGKEAIQELERCLELGLKGLKLWPLTGFYPDDLNFYPFYERVQELELPVLMHMGSGPPNTYIKYCQPIYVDKVAIDFPDMKIIMAHMGDPFTNQAISVASKNFNIYLDISAWEPVLKRVPAAFIHTLFQAKSVCGIDKILFGSDWPLFVSFLSLKDWVKGIRKLKIPPPLRLMGLTDFTEEDKDKILGINAAKVLGL